ncbi:MAG: penicillin-binding protein 2, partial [Actinobacteria bacterium]|nr:penicillin-binding protein 2 [Actinomycetota bacterium]
MSDRSNLRLVVLGVLVFSLLCTLGARLVYLQLVAGESFKAQAVDNSTRDLVTPAVRGLILDQDGRPLVANRVSLVVSVDRAALRKQDDDGA